MKIGSAQRSNSNDTKSLDKAVWYSTADIFEDETPQPEVQIRPVHWKKRAEMVESATEIQAIPHPDMPGTFLYPERFNRWTFNDLLLKYAVVGLKHFEYPDGTPLKGDKPEDIDYLLDETGGEFALWLQQLIIRVSDQADEMREAMQETDAKN
jgi:hypothetical protein